MDRVTLPACVGLDELCHAVPHYIPRQKRMTGFDGKIVNRPGQGGPRDIPGPEITKLPTPGSIHHLIVLLEGRRVGMTGRRRSERTSRVALLGSRGRIPVIETVFNV